MAALTSAQVRQRVDAAMSAEGTFSKSRFHAELFGLDARALMHGTYAVGAPLMEIHPTTQRQKTAEGALVNQQIEVHIAGNHRADAQVSDFDALLDLEALAIKTVEGISRTNLHIVFEQARRELTTEFEFALSHLTFRAIHRLALE